MGIRLSPKHGVNPSILKCPVCGEGDSLALCGFLPGDREAPRYIMDQEPCQKCKDEIESYTKLGMVFLVTREEIPPEPSSPWHYFFGLSVMKIEAARELIANEQILDKRIVWVDYDLADKIGLVDAIKQVAPGERKDG